MTIEPWDYYAGKIIEGIYNNSTMWETYGHLADEYVISLIANRADQILQERNKRFGKAKEAENA